MFGCYMEVMPPSATIICMQAQSLTWLNVIIYLNSYETAEKVYLLQAKYTQ